MDAPTFDTQKQGWTEPVPYDHEVVIVLTKRERFVGFPATTVNASLADVKRMIEDDHPECKVDVIPVNCRPTVSITD